MYWSALVSSLVATPSILCFQAQFFADFLDHAIRQWPSEQYTAIKRSFFARGTVTHTLDNVCHAMKGVYSSIRLCNVSYGFVICGYSLILI